MSDQIFDTIEYLKTGNSRQRSAYDTLVKYHIMEVLADFNPILTGTVPIGIDIPGSDLDIICCYDSVDEFEDTIASNFKSFKKFNIGHNQDNESIIADFYADDWEIEIFGQPVPTHLQNAYRHMIIENKLLLLHGEDFRDTIIALKKEGYKTEPAFAKASGLQGDPYQALLDMDI
ncbi:DUF4269 domain-containing protein [Mucilaginibacter sp. JRF]|uniref:DUF4269 domain-containing protein n=1 Tax=Mucilaginibacter sp. JRF TaxID=2780088 RepID=UPI001880F566|nr:DUF4269 domain-containing protein [Mucilaginibacter sp. JRF]MBE9583693.1 DUF4269 domain-containing protein [Mucilaginibacter sp. JRF]